MADPLASVPVPRVVVPSRKVTVPVGVPPDDVTAAVNVTVWPVKAGFADDVTAVLVAAADGVGCPLPPPQATWNTQPAAISATSPTATSLPRFALGTNTDPITAAGNRSHTAERAAVCRPLSAGAAAPVVVTVSIEVPAGVIALKLHTGARVTAGRMLLQERTTLAGLNPPTGVIVIVEVLDAPAATDPGVNGVAANVNAGPFTTWIDAGEMLAT